MTACKIVIHGRSCDTLCGLVLSNSKSADVLKTMLMFDKKFVLEYGFSLTEGKAKGIAADLKGSNFLPEAGLATYERHTLVVKTSLRCSKALKCVQDEAPENFDSKQLDEKTLETFKISDTMLLFRVAQPYLSNTDTPRGDLPAHAFARLERSTRVLSGRFYRRCAATSSISLLYLRLTAFWILRYLFQSLQKPRLRF